MQEVLGPEDAPPEKGKNGGRREGAGRKAGRKLMVYRDARIVRKILFDGEAQPIEVLIYNMRFYWKRAQALTERLAEAEQFFELMTPEMMKEFILDPVKMAEANEQLERLTKLMGKVEKYRDKAQECAVDAAPYCHPKLAAMQIKVEGEGGDSKKPNLLDITPTNAIEAMQSYTDFLKQGVG